VRSTRLTNAKRLGARTLYGDFTSDRKKGKRSLRATIPRGQKKTKEERKKDGLDARGERF